MSRSITIFDTTLRDGEQSPGASMNLSEKLEVASALAELGVDVIEAGFAISSPGDFESIQEISKLIKGVSVCSLSRCRDADIDCAWDALKYAENPRIHVVLATSSIHREFKLRKSEDEIIEMAVAGVKRARGYCGNVEFSAEDAARTDIDYLCRVVEAVINVGATTVNIPDTVGYTTPIEMFARIEMLRNRVPNIDKAVISVHCHNDLGMAVANSLAAVHAGAGQIECCINGLGERAGNCALEEVVMALKIREDFYQAKTRIQTPRLVATSRLVSTVTGLRVPRNKAIVGQNAFAHESGIHQDGVLKNPTTYEIMKPEDVGFQKNDIVLGKHSGRAALVARAKHLSYSLAVEQLDAVFEEFKKLADRKKQVFDADLRALIEQNIREQGSTGIFVPKSELKKAEWVLGSYELRTRTGKNPDVSITLQCGDTQYTQSVGEGDGPIDALFQAVLQIVGVKATLKEYHVQSVSVGEDAQGEVSVLIQTGEGDEHVFRGHGVSTDTIEATIQAILAAINRFTGTLRV
ncbi:MAG: 2-isopropylmalate synthase [Planctomycetaceae bacterium]|nr:2-isopropylmalate synthase [Planctomycetaceae bacterium]